MEAERHPAGGDVVLSVRGLKKTIRGRPIIRGVSFDVLAGEIFGFLGPNGSGKTTTIRMLVGLARPTAGSIVVCGFDLVKQHDRALAQIGCIVENPEMYPFMTGWQNLEHFARMTPGVTEERIREVVAVVGLERRIHDKVKTYSLGMRQRLGIAQALLGRPRLLVLDEPTNGLDPQGIREMREFLRRLAEEEGMGVFVSSHLLSEVEQMCDRVAILSKGETIAVGSVDELIRGIGQTVVWTVDEPERARRELAAFAASVDRDELTDGRGQHGFVRLAARMEESRIAEANAALVAAGVRVGGVEVRRPTLEELFLRLTEGSAVG
ncbi:MAG: ABC transporter ATP-binding protein [Candidatus Reconcilbacillus cellulovorans]|uniref:ABC transporter ATP-binding protein n=1 Tax=Candidatus Reconcilbacillus cellulovorans TaxID=1906605 RepID=A0A2A6E3S6_9BACL|nr:MAG: ABC transporter ATP-binding protein [Candidatus Reconcilbacillus cellulovorans]